MYLSIWLGITLSTTQTGCTVGKFELPSLRSSSPIAIAPATPTMMEPSAPLNANVNIPSVPPPGARVRYSSVTTDQPVLAMTFDDGPHPVHTPKLLDMLRARNIKCTFFLVGQLVPRYPDIVRRILADGHEIGNHTYTHCSLTSRSDAQIRTELQKSQDAVLSVAGYRPRLLRPPYGATNRRIEQWIFNEFGYSTVMWSVDPQDWRKPGSSVVTSRLVNGAHKGAIMLAHDIHAPTITAMPAMFDQLLAKGYRFVTVSQLMNIEKSTMPLGVVIRHAEPVTDNAVRTASKAGGS
ncbi:MAG: polysaccharide deacetylase family protein [Verrucomicrobiaceae bacterium]|nr:polysaccharide deacetylase family protein [Verrucomicrobiaceae bacterium]